MEGFELRSLLEVMLEPWHFHPLTVFTIRKYPSFPFKLQKLSLSSGYDEHKIVLGG